MTEKKCNYLLTNPAFTGFFGGRTFDCNQNIQSSAGIGIGTLV